MKYSIIIPVLNEEYYIRRSVHSVAVQDFLREEFEIIVVDNGSTDKSIDIAKQTGADIVVYEEKRGTNSARNKGITVSSGEILIFIDADTEPDAHWLSRIDNILRDTTIGAISGPYEYGFRGIKKIISFFVYEIGFEIIGPIISFLLRKPVSAFMGGNFAVRRKAIEKIKKFPEIPFWGDDTAISMMLMAVGEKVVFTRKIKIKSSDRRFRSEGFIILSLKYFYHFFRMYFTFNV
ncbi:glycosyltransferase [Candidatus Parcubacteria bacterium]|jgi:glycosyltransferase involved in cell wall biosynthesis|nr:MAG: glycosyltransferase [Candidatus Parcubacteria bacterium]